MESKKYRNYFQINESYFPAVNEDVIKTQPDHWKTYYPHESFIKLLEQTKSVLTSKQKLSIWVEGAYGTGKSHAVLTLKKLLDCSNDELKAYFDTYKNVFKSNDLYNEFFNIKNQTKKVLTVHRYGSSNVRNDNILVNLVQESIIKALKENGYEYAGQVGIKQAMINWLEDDANRQYFNNIIQKDYRTKFGGADADTILEQLKTYTSEDAIQSLTEKISTVGEEKGIKPFVLQKENLREWIIDVVDKNNLKAIFFIWDEFSDYFSLNKGDLSGFQFLAELSESYPFYFVIVTHKSEIFFENSKSDLKTKINGRFIAPHCSIELPDNMAFILTGHAMQKKEDPIILKEWEENIEALYDETHDSREEVKKTAKIGEAELKGVLPIHPYAALVLKHIASAFDSNQRSMFDFIKNDRGDEIKGFQWFIDNYGPDDDENLLTVDLLWDFFYEKGKDQLAPQTRMVLDVYGRTESHNLTTKQKRVLKTLLLLQAINEKVGDSVALFVPNKKNLGLAFEGTDITPGNASSLADTLIKEQIIFERPMGGGAVKYSALVSNGNLEEIQKLKDQISREIRTNKLVEEGEFANDFKLPKNLEIRFHTSHLTYENIKMELVKLKADSANHPSRLYIVYTFARNDDESTRIRQEIDKCIEDGFDKVIFVDQSSNHLSNDLLNQYVENMANCKYQTGKDAGQARTYDKNAKESLRRWKLSIQNGTCKIYSHMNPEGILCTSDAEITMAVKEFDREHFTHALEIQVNVIDNMYASNALKQGVECGITGEIKGTFKSANENTKLEKQFAGVWNVDNYWITKPNELLSRVKIKVEEIIKDKFDKNTRVSIVDIYDALTEEPFGLLPCNLTAFVMGFVLKEYANDTFNWSDDLTTVPMSVDKMKEMIEEVIKQQQTPSNKYRPKYIVEMSPEQREFNKATAFAFDIDESVCTSVENTRSRVRSQMSSYKFPIWTLKYCNFSTANDKYTVDKLLDLYVELANNSTSARTETDIALDIGRLYLDNKGLSADLKNMLTKENCTTGMHKYLEEYDGGKLLKLAHQLNDSGAYILEISKKFSEASNWVWNKNTVDEKIDETIIEYEIICESNGFNAKTVTYEDCLSEWKNKCAMFKIAYYSVKNDVGNLASFLEVLYQLKKNGYIYDNSKETFLNCLKTKKEEFKEFCENQVTILEKTEGFYLDELTDSDISAIASKLYDVFTMENSEYQRRLEAEVADYKANMSKYQLVELWKKKTGTNSPLEWSDKYSMPILCMLSAQEQNEARFVFDVINNQIGEKNKIDESIEYLEKFKFDDLNSATARDEAFKKYILKSYVTMLENIEEVKKTIRSKLSSVAPYYWLGNSAVEDLLKNLAFQKYNNGGNSKVYSVIDSMSPDDLKKYLKDLVKENMVVGIEIIKNNK